MAKMKKNKKQTFSKTKKRKIKNKLPVITEKIKQKDESSPTQKNKEEVGWLNIRVFVLLGIIFLITQVIGLFVANSLIAQGFAQAPFTDDINDPLNSIYLFFVIIGMTIAILLALRFKRQRNFLWIIEALAIFVTSTVVFSSFIFDDLIVLLLAILILVWRYTHRKSVWFRDIVGIIAIAGAGSFIGISLGIIPIIIFIIILATYDMIAVFGTKHMLTIGKSVVKNNFAFTIAMPTKKHTFELGNGDLVIPLMTASSVLANGFFANNILVAGMVLVASFIGLVISIYIVSVKKIALPALPPQTVLMLVVLFLAMLIGL